MNYLLPILSFLILYLSMFSAPVFSGYEYASLICYVLSACLIIVWVVKFGRRSFDNLLKTQFSNSSFGLLSIVSAFVLFILVALISNDPEYDLRIDVSLNESNTLSDESVSIIGRLNQEKIQVEVFGFFENVKEKEKFQRLMDMYFSKNLSVKMQYYHPQRSPIKTKFYEVKDPNTVVFKNRKTIHRITEFTETNVSNALLLVSRNKKKAIYFSTGQGELSLEEKSVAGMSLLYSHLKKSVYEVKKINLIGSSSIPKDADILVIAGPEFDVHKNTVKALSHYLKHGGAIFILTEALRPVKNISQLVGYFGVSIREDLVILNQSDPRASMFGQNNALVDNFNQFHPVGSDFSSNKTAAVLFPNSRSLQAGESKIAGFKAEYVGQTTKSNVRVINVFKPSDLKKLKDNQFKFEPATILAATSRVNEGVRSRMVISGSAQIINNQNFVRSENRKLIDSIFHYLGGEDDLVKIAAVSNQRKVLNLNSAESQMALSVISFFFPLLFLILGILRWFRGDSL